MTVFVHSIVIICFKFLFVDRLGPTATLSLGSYLWQSSYNWVVDRMNMPVEDLIRSQLQSEEEFTDQRSSHFKLCIAVYFKSL